MKKKIELEYCDACGYDKSQPHVNIATTVCGLCEKHLCSAGKHGMDNYYTFQHFDHRPIMPFICRECWELAMADSGRYDKQFKELMRKGASGSGFAISMAEFHDGLLNEFKKLVGQELFNRIKSLRDGRLEVEMLKIKKEEIEREYRKKLDDLKI